MRNCVHSLMGYLGSLGSNLVGIVGDKAAGTAGDSAAGSAKAGSRAAGCRRSVWVRRHSCSSSSRGCSSLGSRSGPRRPSAFVIATFLETEIKWSLYTILNHNTFHLLSHLIIIFAFYKVNKVLC